MLLNGMLLHNEQPFTLHSISCIYKTVIYRDLYCYHFISQTLGSGTPHAVGVPPFCLCSSLVHSLPHLLLFITFSLFPFSNSLYLFSSIVLFIIVLSVLLS